MKLSQITDNGDLPQLGEPCWSGRQITTREACPNPVETLVEIVGTEGEEAGCFMPVGLCGACAAMIIAQSAWHAGISADDLGDYLCPACGALALEESPSPGALCGACANVGGHG